MVTTRHSLPRPRSPTPDLADLDSREAARLATNARFDRAGRNKNKDDEEDGEEEAENLGTYHWRGAVYAITKDTPREWIEQGEAEWAGVMRKRERVKREREEGVRERREEELRKRKMREEEEEEEEARKKRKVAEEKDVKERVRREEQERKRKERRSGKGKGKEQTTTGLGLPTRPRPSDALTSSPPSSRRRAQASNSSTASSNIQVALSSKQRRQQETASHPPPRRPDHDISDDDDTPSEPDSAGDLPTTASAANVLAGLSTIPHIAASRAASKKKGQHTTPVPKKPTREEIIRSLTVNLYALGRTNDRVEQLRKVWDSSFSAGAFQRLVDTVRKIKQGRKNEQKALKELQHFADTIGDDANVSSLLSDMALEEEERRKGGGDVEEENDKNDATMQDIPTPESLVPAPVVVQVSQHNHPITTPATIQPTPPASEHSETQNPTTKSLISPAPLSALLLPAHDRGGNPLRWSLDPVKLNEIKVKDKEMRDPDRAEFEIHKERFEGETKSQRRRRVRRELREVDGWSIIPDPALGVEGEGDGDDGDGEEGDGEEMDGGEGMEDLVYEHRDEEHEEDDVDGEEEVQETPEVDEDAVDGGGKGDWEVRGGAAAEKVMIQGGRVGRGKSRRRVRR